MTTNGFGGDCVAGVRGLDMAEFEAGPSRSATPLTKDRTFEQRIQTVDHPVIGSSRMVARPVRFSGRLQRVKPTPLLGANHGDVLANGLGLGADHASSLCVESIIG